MTGKENRSFHSCGGPEGTLKRKEGRSRFLGREGISQRGRSNIRGRK